MKTVKKTTKIKVPEVGDKIYVPSSFSISHGSDDFSGGRATVKRVYKNMSGGDADCIFVDIVEGDRGYNWTQFIGPDQAELKKEYGKQKAHPSPDINTPWIEEGDTVDGKVYHGPPIW